MAESVLILFVHDGPWQAAVGQGGEIAWLHPEAADDSPGAQAKVIKQALDETHDQIETVVLALPTAWVLCANVPAGDLPRRQRHQTLAYRLEESVPIAAESYVADFIEHTHEALGVCVALERVQPICQALQAVDLPVQMICPTALLAAQHAYRTLPDETNLLLWRNGAWVEAVACEKRLPIRWCRLPAVLPEALPEVNDLEHQLAMAFGDQFNRVHTIELDEADVTDAEQGLPEAAACEATLLASGNEQPWFNLARETLTPTDWQDRLQRPMQLAMASIALFMLICCGVFLWRHHTWQAVASDQRALQTRLFAELFPDQTAPPSIRRRLMSEYEQLKAITGTTDLPQHTPTLTLIHDTLASLPNDKRFRLEEMRFTPTQVRLDGMVRRHGDADALAQALRREVHLIVDAPHTQKQRDGVAFNLHAWLSPLNQGGKR